MFDFPFFSFVCNGLFHAFLFMFMFSFDLSVVGALQEVKRALIDADVNLKVTNNLVAAVKEKAVGSKLVDGERPFFFSSS